MKEYMEHFKITRRTAERDFKYLREHYNFRFNYDRNTKKITVVKPEKILYGDINGSI